MRILYYIQIRHTLEELGCLAKPLLEELKKIDGPQIDGPQAEKIYAKPTLEKLKQLKQIYGPQIFGPQAEKIYREKTNQWRAAITQHLEERGLNTPEKCKKMHIYVDGLTAQQFYCKTCFDKTGEKRYMDEIASNKIRCSFCGRMVEKAVDEFLLKLVHAFIEERLERYLVIAQLIEKGAKVHGTESQALLVEEHNMWVNLAKGINPDPNRKEAVLRERDKFIVRRINETLPKDEIGILFIGATHTVDDEIRKFPDIKVIYL